MSTSDGSIFVDRNPKYFAYVLDFLRSEQIEYPDSFEENKMIFAEFNFWEIPFPNDNTIEFEAKGISIR